MPISRQLFCSEAIFVGANAGNLTTCHIGTLERLKYQFYYNHSFRYRKMHHIYPHNLCSFRPLSPLTLSLIMFVFFATLTDTDHGSSSGYFTETETSSSLSGGEDESQKVYMYIGNETNSSRKMKEFNSEEPRKVIAQHLLIIRKLIYEFNHV